MTRPFLADSRRPPLAWFTFTKWLKLSDALGQCWWQALCRSELSTAQILRQNFAHANLFKLTPRELAYQTCKPARLVALIEELTTGGLLSRRNGTFIEEAIFRCIRPAYPSLMPKGLKEAIFTREREQPVAQTWR